MVGSKKHKSCRGISRIHINRYEQETSQAARISDTVCVVQTMAATIKKTRRSHAPTDQGFTGLRHLILR
jgi:hypothetical protein